MNDISILSLALTVMLGPQILVAMLLLTRKDTIKSSLIYILAITLTITATTCFYYYLINITGFHKVSVSDRPILKYCLILLFVYLIIKNFRGRKKITEPPKWIKGITNTSLSKIFKTGVLLIAIMPTDIIMAFTVGSTMNNNPKKYFIAISFFITVAIIASIPLLLFLLFGNKSQQYIEKAKNWTDTHGYLINIIVLSFFIYLTI